MSETGNHCNEPATSENSLDDSVVTDTTRNSPEQITSKILCGLQGLEQKDMGTVASPRWTSKFAPSIDSASTGMSSPLVPFQAASRHNLLGKSDNCSEPVSPSILPQADRWTESFSIIPSFLKKPSASHHMESQSQSLLPQTDIRTENLSHQPGLGKTSSSAANVPEAGFQCETPMSARSTQKLGEKTKAGKTAKKKCSPKQSKIPQDAGKIKSSQKPKKSIKETKQLPSSSTSTECSSKTIAQVSSPFSSQTTMKFPSDVMADKKKPSSLDIPTQSSAGETAVDATAKITERIEKQLEEMEKAPRRKVLVIEAAVVHCMTSVQDSIENKLTKLRHSYRPENADILRKLLHTLKTTLGRLIEKHKQEREHFATTTQASQLSQEDTTAQKTQLIELGKRQKRVFSLFTKQRALATELKKIETLNKDASEISMASEADISVTINRGKGEGNIVKDLNQKEVNTQDKMIGSIPKNEEAYIEETENDENKDDTQLSSSGPGNQMLKVSGSGLGDVLEILGNRKRQKSISELAKSVHELANMSDSHASSTSVLADQDSIKDDITVDTSTAGENMDDLRDKRVNSVEGEVTKNVMNDGDELLREKLEIKERHSAEEIALKAVSCNDLTKVKAVNAEIKTQVKGTKECSSVEENSEKLEQDTVEDINYEIIKSGQKNEMDKTNEKQSELGDIVRKPSHQSKNNKTTSKNIKSTREKTISSTVNMKDNNKKRSLSDFDPSDGGIDPRTVYRQAMEPETANTNHLNDESSPKAISPNAFYSQNRQVMKGKPARGKNSTVEIADDVSDKDDSVTFSQDVTTIPDTQGLSTQETFTRETPDLVPATEESGTRAKRKGREPSEENVSSRKKYTKIQTPEERSGRADSGIEAQNEAFKETTDSDETTAEVVLDSHVNMFHEKSVSVSLKTSVNDVSVSSVNDIQKELGSQKSFVSREDVPQKPLISVNSNQGEGSHKVLSEHSLAKITENDNSMTKSTKNVSNNVKGESKSVPLKSPGEKLDSVIKRITQGKENKMNAKEYFKDKTNFKKPESCQRLNEHRTDTGEKKVGREIDMSYDSLYQAGLVVELSHPGAHVTEQQQSKNVSQMFKTNPVLFSPPRELQDENYTDVSPTATSMSSDVFLVKAKELDKRMKIRAKVSQTQTDEPEKHRTSTTSQKMATISTKPQAYGNSTSNTNVTEPVAPKMSKHNKGNWISVLPKQTNDQKQFKFPTSLQNQTQTSAAKYDKSSMSKTTEQNLEAVINDVIKSAASREQEFPHSQTINSQHVFSQKAAKLNQPTGCPAWTPAKPYNPKGYQTLTAANTVKPKTCQVPGLGTDMEMSRQDLSQPLEVVEDKTKTMPVTDGPDIRQKSIHNEMRNSQTFKTAETQESMAVGVMPARALLPTLKILLFTGILKPGTSVLSTSLQGETFTSSLTPQGLIKSAEGEVFRTPMLWLMSLEGDGKTIKRRKSYERITYCGHPLLSYCNNKGQHFNQTTDKQTTGSCVRSEVTVTGSWEDTDEGRLNRFLSCCYIRLLSKEDLIPCHDLPDNFWANDFADVKVPSYIWECVDNWD